MNREEADVIIDHLAQITVLYALTVSIIRALPHELQARTLQQFDEEVAIVKTMLLNSTHPEALIRAFDKHVQIVNDLRLDISKNL